MSTWKYTTPQETPEVLESIEKSSKVMKKIYTDKVDRPIGPYSHGMVTISKPINGLIFLCGQTPCLPDNTVVGGTVAEKTRLMCENTKAALEAAGSSLDKVVKVQVFFTDLKDYEESNSVYVQYFPHIPARTCFQVSAIPPANTSMQLDIIALQD